MDNQAKHCKFVIIFDKKSKASSLSNAVYCKLCRLTIVVIMIVILLFYVCKLIIEQQ